ncbi:MAG: hypothetical protein PUC50_16785 [Bacteroidales bacterium]|nr:hypothetical protein [Bacteroidales bacterium]
MTQSYTLQQFAELFLVNTHTVSRWLSIGMIKGEPQPDETRWLIPKSEVNTVNTLNIRYLKASPLLYD